MENGLATLSGATIRVGVAGPGMKFRTLDDSERLMPENALMILDGQRPVAVAGVMGGAETEVSERTTTEGGGAAASRDSSSSKEIESPS